MASNNVPILNIIFLSLLILIIVNPALSASSPSSTDNKKNQSSSPLPSPSSSGNKNNQSPSPSPSSSANKNNQSSSPSPSPSSIDKKNNQSSDVNNLLMFKETLEDANGALSNWNKSKPPCYSQMQINWAGVLCSNKGSVWGLKLENMGLKGEIHVEALANMTSLITISLMNNSFEGPLPELKKLNDITSIYLSHNNFSGEIPIRAFEGMVMLKKLHVDDNKFTGPIPLSLTLIPRLSELDLQDNSFEGEIPEFRQKRMPRVNVTNNDLQGAVPVTLNKLNESLFQGNKYLCGKPLAPCASAYKVSTGTLLVIVLVMAIALTAIAAAFIIIYRHRKSNTKVASVDIDQTNPSSDLMFLRDDRENFDLGDLLKASAEILGSGVFGASYRAALGVGSVMVVKRFRQMNNVGKDEFQEHMRRLGRLRHVNLLPLVAYYYRREEKLLVSDYVDNACLAVYLHGNRQPGLDWAARLKVVKGVVRGLVYLYNELPCLIAPNGHLKSSNVLLSKSFEPMLTDYGLIPIINQEHAQELMIAYKSPEYKLFGRITKKTDVYSLGILILEILTGKFPATSMHQGKGIDTDLATWVQSVICEELSSNVEVFDKDIGGTKNSRGEMSKLLKIGLTCCEVNVEKRIDLKEAAKRIEELRETDT